jgi:hypothetical protein
VTPIWAAPRSRGAHSFLYSDAPARDHAEHPDDEI